MSACSSSIRANERAIVTHFGDLGALKQLPGLAIQRLEEKGYGFGAEGDWKVKKANREKNRLSTAVILLLLQLLKEQERLLQVMNL